MTGAIGTVRRQVGPVGVVGVLVVAAVALAACSSSSSSSTTTSPPPTTASSTSSTSSTGVQSSTSSTAAAASGAENLPVTDAIRSQLVAARAAQVGVAPSTYTGLVPGSTYYALDTVTGTYWAAGQTAVPSTVANPGTDLYKAQVASQDDGSYLVFSKQGGGSWTVTPVGSSGPYSTCGVAVPAAVVAAWGWPAGSCRAPGH